MNRQKKQKKSGFTLVELMVVAIIVAILAAVAIPLMSGNRNRAIATEAQAGCSTIATGIRMHWVQSNATTNGAPDVLPGINDEDLDGTYFRHEDYSFTMTDGSTYTITADGSEGDVIMTVVNGQASWSGDLLD